MSFNFVSDPDQPNEDINTVLDRTREEVDEVHEIIGTKKKVKEEGEERTLATEQEQKDYEKYVREFDKQHEIIDSYEKLLIKKEQEETRKELDRFMNQIKLRAGRLRAQGKKAQDKYGKTSQYYTDIWNAIKSESPSFLGANLYKQHRLLELLVSEYDDRRKPEEVIRDLAIEFPEIIDWS